MKKNHHGSQNESSIMKHTIKIKGALGTLCITCMAWAGQGLAAEKPASPPTAAEEKVTASVPDKEDPLKRDQAAIQGKWQVVAMRAAGNPGPDAVIAVMKYEFKGNRLIITPAEPGPGYTFKLDPSSKPAATFDMTPVGSKKPADTMQGIYVLDGDQLKLCLGKKKRPTEMRAEAKDGFGQMLIELEREKP